MITGLNLKRRRIPLNFYEKEEGGTPINKKEMSPPISYYGGKQRLASKISSYIPKHTVYVEPFCGGAAILFKKPYPKITNTNHYREVINDIDNNLVNFFKQLRDNGNELVRKIELTLYSQEEHKISKDLDIDDDLERARRYYINIQQSFSNLLNSGWRTGVYGRNLSLTWKNKINNLSSFVDRMQGVHISSEDAIRCISRWDSPQTFFYIDPPYMNANQGHYRGYSIGDYQDLIEKLKNVQGSFILSNYPNSTIVPEEWEKIQFERHCFSSVSGQTNQKNKSKAANKEELGERKRTEEIYIKLRTKELRPDLHKLLYDTDQFNCFTGEDRC